MTLAWLLARQHLLNEPLRAILTVTGVGLGVAVYVAVATANREVLRSFDQAVMEIAGSTTLQVTSAVAAPQGFDETSIQTIQNTDGVMIAAPVLEITAIWSAGSSRAVALPILGVDLLSESSFRHYTIVDESSGDEWERYLEPDAIYVGRALAARYGLSVGAVLDVRAGALARRLVVHGLIDALGSGRTVLEELAVMDIAAAQFTFDRIGRLDRVDIVTEADYAIEQVREAIQAALPPGFLVKRPEQRNAQIERMTRAFRLNIMSLGAVAFLVGLFLVYNTMAFAVVRRRREIGILRSLGMLPREIGRLFLIEAVAVGALGSVVGIIMGIVLAQGALRMMASTAASLYSVAAASEAMTIAAGVLGQSFFIGIGVAVLGSIGPILEAGAIQPVQALAPKGYEESKTRRGQTRSLGKVVLLLVLSGLAALPGPVRELPVFGYVSAFFLLAAFAALSPVVISAMGPAFQRCFGGRIGTLARIAAQELERAPVRNAVAVSALMVGLALMIGMTILVHSFRMTLDMWLDQTVKADVIVAPPTWLGSGPQAVLPESIREHLRDLPGVAAVDAYRDLRMEFRERPVTLVARDLLLHARHSRYLFLQGNSTVLLTEAVRKDQIIVSESFANQFKLRQGDRVTLQGPQGPLDFPIAGVFYDYATDGGKIVMDRALFVRLWQDRTLTVVPLYMVPGSDPQIIRREIFSRLRGDLPVMVVTNAELKREVLKIFDQTFAITYALELIAVVVGLLGIINSLLSGILERQRELSMLRAIGATPSQVGRLILWESGLLGLAGAILGVLAGYLLSVLLIEVINKQSFGWTILFHPSPLPVLQAVGLSLVITLISGYGPALRAARLPVAEGLHYE